MAGQKSLLVDVKNQKLANHTDCEPESLRPAKREQGLPFIFISLTFPGLESDQGRFDKIVVATVDVKAQDKTGHVALLTGEFLVGGTEKQKKACEGKLNQYNNDLNYCIAAEYSCKENDKVDDLCMASKLRTFQAGGKNGWGEGDVGGSFLLGIMKIPGDQQQDLW